LLISAGGQNGAYAAGFLRGWENRTQPGMPHFDLVTGVATSALQAPFALLGTQVALDRGAALYRSDAVELSPAPEFWGPLQRANEFKDTRAYDDLVASLLDPPLQAELFHEFQDKRSVAIATTDFDLGAQRVWELGRELGDTESGMVRTRALLAASASVPGVFAPVMIDRHVHASGDVSSSLLMPLQFDDFRALTARLRALGVSESVQVRLWVIFNGFANAAEARVDPASRLEMAERSHVLLFRANQAQQIEKLIDLTRAVDRGVRGLRMELRVTMIPPELAEEPGADASYNSAWMLRLEQFGYERARSESAWDTVVIPRDREDRYD
jgi:hypothetical protein